MRIPPPELALMVGAVQRPLAFQPKRVQILLTTATGKLGTTEWTTIPIRLQSRLEVAKQKQLKNSATGSSAFLVLVMPRVDCRRLPSLHDQRYWFGENDRLDQADHAGRRRHSGILPTDLLVLWVARLSLLPALPGSNSSSPVLVNR